MGFGRTCGSWLELMRACARTAELCVASETAGELLWSYGKTYGEGVVASGQHWTDLRGVDSGFCQDLWRMVRSAAVGAQHR